MTHHQRHDATVPYRLARRVPFATCASRLCRDVALAFVLLPWLICNRALAAATTSDPVRELLRNRIEALGSPPALSVREEPLIAVERLRAFYERRLYRPAWNDPSPSAVELLDALQAAGLHGLEPTHYHAKQIQSLLGEWGSTADEQARIRISTDLDLTLSDAFLAYGSHLLAGRVNPETLEPDWIAAPRSMDVPAALEQALRSGKIRATLEGLAPAQAGYRRLQDALVRYRELVRAGGWDAVPTGPTLRPADRSVRVARTRHRLLQEGYAADPREAGAVDVFDASLERAVREFQQRSGLRTDGVVGPATLSALNVSAADRVHQIQVNLERWRWLPEHLGRRHVRVNIADFSLDVVEDGNSLLSMAVVVGKSYHRTPVFTALMTYLVFSPTWNVPPGIARKEILPAVRRDPGHLANNGIRVLRGWGSQAQEIDPSAIDWKRASLERLGLRFRQDPGPKNALGRVKFMFPNRFQVYLHDTPARGLFARERRDFSHGCIRVAKPLELAAYLLHGDPKWTGKTNAAAMEEGVETTVPLRDPLSVHLQYCTAWVSEDGEVHFRADIYGRDARLARALLATRGDGQGADARAR